MNTEPCEGVWLPDGTVRCFVEQFTQPRDYEPSIDHRVPRSQGGTDDWANLHLVHGGCQNRQGGYIAGALHGNPGTTEGRLKGGRAGGLRHQELYGNPGTFDSRSLGGTVGGRIGGRKNLESGHYATVCGLGRHTRWHINRSILDEDCAHCEEIRG